MMNHFLKLSFVLYLFFSSQGLDKQFWNSRGNWFSRLHGFTVLRRGAYYGYNSTGWLLNANFCKN